MGVRILVAGGPEVSPDAPHKAALICSTSCVALKCPLFDDYAEADAFLEWHAIRHGADPATYRSNVRFYNSNELAGIVAAFRARASQ